GPLAETGARLAARRSGPLGRPPGRLAEEPFGRPKRAAALAAREGSGRHPGTGRTGQAARARTVRLHPGLGRRPGVLGPVPGGPAGEVNGPRSRPRPEPRPP